MMKSVANDKSEVPSARDDNDAEALLWETPPKKLTSSKNVGYYQVFKNHFLANLNDKKKHRKREQNQKEKRRLDQRGKET